MKGNRKMRVEVEELGIKLDNNITVVMPTVIHGIPIQENDIEISITKTAGEFM